MSITVLYGMTLHADTVPALLSIATRHLPQATTYTHSVRSLIATAAESHERGDDDEAVDCALQAVYLSVGNRHPDYGHACRLVQLERRAA
jgi:hypothetical protein